MKLSLRFEDDDRSRERFRQIYNGLVTGASLASQQRDPRDSGKTLRTVDDTEREADIHEALEAVSAEGDGMTGTGEPMREVSAPCEVILAQPAIATLKKYMEQFIVSPFCKSTSTRHATDALQFVKNAPEAKG